MGLIVATKAFFKLLVNRELSDSFQKLLDGQLVPQIAAKPTEDKPVEKAAPKPPPKSVRSEALTLLSALQREARFVDIVREPLEQYSDAQVGAAARDVLKNSGAVIERMFGLEPVTGAEDGSQMSTPHEIDPAEYRLVGNVSGKPPYTGTLAHHGWRATRCEVPQWNGSNDAAMILAPVEIEIT